MQIFKNYLIFGRFLVFDITVCQVQVIVLCTFMPSRQICTKAVGVQITASVTRNMMRVYIWSEICSVIEMVPITLSQCLFRLSSRREKDVELTLGVKKSIQM